MRFRLSTSVTSLSWRQHAFRITTTHQRVATPPRFMFSCSKPWWFFSHSFTTVVSASTFPAVDEERRERAAHEQPLAAGGEARREHRVLEHAQLLLQLARPRPDAHLAVVGGAHDLAAVSLRVNGDRRGLRSSRWT